LTRFHRPTLGALAKLVAVITVLSTANGSPDRIGRAGQEPLASMQIIVGIAFITGLRVAARIGKRTSHRPCSGRAELSLYPMLLRGARQQIVIKASGGHKSASATIKVGREGGTTTT
jgi:hypothetical protein